MKQSLAPVRRIALSFVVLSIGIGALAACVPSSAPTQCDTLAASALDATRPAGVTGVEFAAIDGPRAVEACRLEAERSDRPRSWNQLGRALEKTAQYSDAVQWYSKAATAGHAVAQNNLANLYRRGEGVAHDPLVAAGWYQKAALQGLSIAKLRLGEMLLAGEGIQQDMPRGRQLLRQAADEGNPDAQLAVGRLYAKGDGVAQDDAQAVQWYRKAADQGLASAQNNLGVAYEHGTGVALDLAQALAWYRKAADQGLAQAQSNLGILYATGKGVQQDDVQAAAWVRKAADQGFSQAQGALGLMYVTGNGVAKDTSQALVWLRKAADQGSAQAQVVLGTLYEKGQGVTRDDTQAIAWFRKAADQGLPQAQGALRRLTDSAKPPAAEGAVSKSADKPLTKYDVIFICEQVYAYAEVYDQGQYYGEVSRGLIGYLAEEGKKQGMTFKEVQADFSRRTGLPDAMGPGDYHTDIFQKRLALCKKDGFYAAGLVYSTKMK